MLPAATIRTAIEERLFGEEGGREPISWKTAAGGLSDASVWRVERGQEAYAVRRWWKGIDPRHVAWVSATLNEVVTAGLSYVAAPVVDDDAWPLIDAVSDRWEAAPWKPGTPLDAAPPTWSAVAASVEGLVEFHRRVRNRGRCPVASRSAFVERAARLRALPTGQLRLPQSTTTVFPELARIAEKLSPAARDASQALEPWVNAALPLQPIHGDARPEHFLLDKDSLTGLIDFGAMRVDTPLADLARFAGELAAGDGAYRDTIVAAYSVASGTTVDPRAVAALDLSGAVISGANWLRWLAVPGGVSREPARVRERLRSILARLGGV
ncbi:MAG: aminoglycoside phosphotransferase family protein [Planctomycetota bacterium]